MCLIQRPAPSGPSGHSPPSGSTAAGRALLRLRLTPGEREGQSAAFFSWLLPLAGSLRKALAAKPSPCGPAPSVSSQGVRH